MMVSLRNLESIPLDLLVDSCGILYLMSKVSGSVGLSLWVCSRDVVCYGLRLLFFRVPEVLRVNDEYFMNFGGVEVLDFFFVWCLLIDTRFYTFVGYGV